MFLCSFFSFLSSSFSFGGEGLYWIYMNIWHIPVCETCTLRPLIFTMIKHLAPVEGPGLSTLQCVWDGTPWGLSDTQWVAKWCWQCPLAGARKVWQDSYNHQEAVIYPWPQYWYTYCQSLWCFSWVCGTEKDSYGHCAVDLEGELAFSSRGNIGWCGWFSETVGLLIQRNQYEVFCIKTSV